MPQREDASGGRGGPLQCADRATYRKIRPHLVLRPAQFQVAQNCGAEKACRSDPGCKTAWGWRANVIGLYILSPKKNTWGRSATLTPPPSVIPTSPQNPTETTQNIP